MYRVKSFRRSEIQVSNSSGIQDVGLGIEYSTSFSGLMQVLVGYTDEAEHGEFPTSMPTNLDMHPRSAYQVPKTGNVLNCLMHTLDVMGTVQISPASTLRLLDFPWVPGGSQQGKQTFLAMISS